MLISVPSLPLVEAVQQAEKEGREEEVEVRVTIVLNDSVVAR